MCLTASICEDYQQHISAIIDAIRAISYGSRGFVSPGTGSPSEWSAVFVIGGAKLPKLPGKGLYASEKPSGRVSHEASIIVTKERAEMKMIEFFIARKIVVDGAEIQSHCAVRRKACRVSGQKHADPLCLTLPMMFRHCSAKS